MWNSRDDVPMKRRLLNLLTAVSLLLCAATVALWVRSAEVSDMVGLTWGARSVWAKSRAGSVELEWLSWPPSEVRAWQRFSHLIAEESKPFPPARGAARSGQAGDGKRFRAYRDRTARGTPSWGVVFPHWAMALATTVVPAIWLARARGRRRRRHAGLCTRCGYDMRATPDRCPECGTEAAGAG